MAVTRGDWGNFLKPGARKAFVKHYPSLPAEYTKYFRIETSQRAFEEYLFSSGLGTVPEKPEAEDFALDRPYPLGKIKVSHRGYGLGYEISEEMVEDDLYKVIVPKSSRNLADAHRDAEERLAASIFNLAFTTQLGYDGKALIATDHPTIGAGDISNESASNADFSVASAQAGIEHFMLLEDDRGLKLNVMPSQVVHHPNNYWTVREILRPALEPFTANNTPNVISTDFGLVPSTYKYLTDTDAWYMMKPKTETGPIFFWRRKPRTGSSLEDRPGVWQFWIKSRFSATCLDWRPFYGSTGS